jgi:hypothetical protein
MHKYLLILISCFIILNVNAENIKSPHGNNFKFNCSQCHSTDNWTNMKFNGFNHNKTNFPLIGQHKLLNCKNCHTTLEFSKVKRDCNACHIDIHQQTVGQACEKCHTPNSWIVLNVKKIHQQTGFSLMGSHATADCNRCHVSASLLRFDNRRQDCYSCHNVKYMATTNPNHITAGFDTDCSRCHGMTGIDWTSTRGGFDHSIFPLTGGHNLTCDKCHTDNNYQQKLSSDCLSCHSGKLSIANSLIPGHGTKMLKYACIDCHNSSSWNNVRFPQHDSWFGIYSGKHKGVWTKCIDCHNNDANYLSNCKKCHN